LLLGVAGREAVPGDLDNLRVSEDIWD
jgi:hypothetical protein